MTGVVTGGEPPARAGDGGAAAPAPLGKRAIARVLDFALGVIAFAVMVWVVGVAAGPSPDGTGVVLVAIAAIFVVYWLYEVMPIAVWGRTVGKQLMGLRVVAVDGERPGFVRALRRSLLPMVVLACFFPLYPLVFVAAAFSRDRRGPHDRLAGTVVIRSERGS